MKTILYLICMVCAFSANAQQSANVQKEMEEAKAKLKALQSNPEIAAKMQAAQHLMDSLKQDHKFQKKK